MSQPPTVGPMAGAKVAVSPNMAMPTACWLLGSRVRTITIAVGISTPPVKPCPARNRIIWLKDVESAQASEKAVNRMVFTAR